jgi:hypothetical protein
MFFKVTPHSFFQEKRILFKSEFYATNVEKLLEETAITKLDIKRIYRYLDKNVKYEHDDSNVIDDDDL